MAPPRRGRPLRRQPGAVPGSGPTLSGAPQALVRTSSGSKPATPARGAVFRRACPGVSSATAPEHVSAASPTSRARRRATRRRIPDAMGLQRRRVASIGRYAERGRCRTLPRPFLGGRGMARAHGSAQRGVRTAAGQRPVAPLGLSDTVLAAACSRAPRRRQYRGTLRRWRLCGRQCRLVGRRGCVAARAGQRLHGDFGGNRRWPAGAGLRTIDSATGTGSTWPRSPLGRRRPRSA